MRFNIFISDLQACNSFKMYKYADDCTFIIPRQVEDIAPDIHKVINHMQAWCQSNRMELNLNKTQMLIYKKRKSTIVLQNLPIKPKSVIKIFGVFISKSLKWDNNTIQTIKKASSNIYVLRRFKSFLPKSCLIALYNAFILSQLCYASTVFANLPLKIEKNLERVKKRAHYIICGNLCQNNCLRSPNSQRIQKSIRLYQKAAADKTHKLHSLIPQRHRYSNKFLQPISNTDRRKNSFIPFITEIVRIE